MKIIGLGHYSRVGKDTLANMLAAELYRRDPSLRVVKRPFAWPLKIIAHTLYWWAGHKRPDFYDTAEGAALRDVPLQPLGKTPVEIWVALGNAVRDRVYERTWIQAALFDAAGADVLLIPDVRYPNEALAIREHGGVLVKVVRAGYAPKDTVADRALVGFEGWDFVSGPNLAALEHDARYLAECIAGNRRIEQSPDLRAALLGAEQV